MRAQFVLSEILVGLRRNLTMTFAVIVSVALSLALAGAGLLVREQVSQMQSYWYDRVQVSLFLCNENDQNTSPEVCGGGAVTDEQRESIRADLEKLPVVEEVLYESQEEAYERYKEQFPDSPLVANVSPETMQESFRVALKDPTQYEVITSAFQGRPGVQDIMDQRDTLEPLFNILTQLTWAALIVMLFMLVVAVLLIVNTVRVSAFSRRRETGIMRLVGASNFYIQIPFIMEAAFAGLIGGLLACGFIVAAQQFMVEGRLRESVPLVDFIGWSEIVRVLPLLVVFGVLMSAVAAFLTLRRYLRV
ncbi:permease-like cell division protein FtsX [Allostreptomyces psammosilenae]|uniref:Cell division protein FtsX n=1 Tax=Allostreptomyces psammosilenae TaxID=1892865 RepID=A0A853A6B3_9ACTN|nr:permease-like cell division protein FtsX [Allostreptomyces psammosilenae]NYI06211.1 cell division transport system permease protein [Allostreptomyces psammosilenae]